MFDSLSCSSCGFMFPANTIHIGCPKCGGTAYSSKTSSRAVSVSVRHAYAYRHLLAAALHTRNSGALEKEYGGELSGLRHASDNEAFVIAAIFSTVAFLEATINEFFADIADGHNEEFRRLYATDDTTTQIKNLWGIDVPRTASFSILQKYQIGLALTKKTLFEKGVAPYQDVNLLIQLRNHLIHAEPGDHALFTVGDIIGPKPVRPMLSEGLNGKFPINRLMEQTSNQFFPDKCLGHGCAEWGIVSSLNFADEFFSRVGLTPLYDRTDEELFTTWSEP